eukprot:1020560-Rhodomonas_salina.3
MAGIRNKQCRTTRVREGSYQPLSNAPGGFLHCDTALTRVRHVDAPGASTPHRQVKMICDATRRVSGIAPVQERPSSFRVSVHGIRAVGQQKFSDLASAVGV